MSVLCSHLAENCFGKHALSGNLRQALRCFSNGKLSELLLLCISKCTFGERKTCVPVVSTSVSSKTDSAELGGILKCWLLNYREVVSSGHGSSSWEKWGVLVEERDVRCLGMFSSVKHERDPIGSGRRLLVAWHVETARAEGAVRIWSSGSTLSLNF